MELQGLTRKLNPFNLDTGQSSNLTPQKMHNPGFATGFDNSLFCFPQNGTVYLHFF